MAFGRLRLERERACDDEVLQHGAQPSAYATHLLEIARGLRPALRPSAAIAMARASELEGRLLAVLAARRASVPARSTRWVIAFALTAATVGALGVTFAETQIPAAEPVASRRPFKVLPLDEPTDAERVAAKRARADASEALASSVDPQTRERAVLDLAASGQADTIPSLEAALNDVNQDVREKAALGLALQSSPDVIPALIRALRDPDSQVREKAAIGLALRRDPRVVDALIPGMSDPDAQVREKAALALGTSGDSRAVALLDRALQDPDAQVREKAVTGLMLLREGPSDMPQNDRVRDGLRSLVGALIGLTR
jgi:HEAT repeats